MLLTEEQKQAVYSTDKRILVNACAGSGKTTLLIARIIHLIDDLHVPETSILCFTFTNKAAKNIKYRLEWTLKRKVKVVICTFHAYCYSYILMYHTILGYKEPPKIVSNTYISHLIKKILIDMNLDMSNTEIIRYISNVKNGLSIYLDDQKSLLIHEVIKRLDDELFTRNAITFDDFIHIFTKLIDENEWIEAKVKSYINYILCDEAQDTSSNQVDLINRLHDNVFYVGDFNQTIYSFRNSNIDTFKTIRNSCKVFFLTENFRSDNRILKVCENLIKVNDNDINIKSQLFFDDFSISLRCYDTVFDEAKTVIDEVYYLLQSGVPGNSIAILYRNNSQATFLEKELIKSYIPYSIYGKVSLLKCKYCSSFTNIVRYLFSKDELFLYDYLKEMNIFDEETSKKISTINTLQCVKEVSPELYDKITSINVELSKEALINDVLIKLFDLDRLKLTNLYKLKDILLTMEEESLLDCLNQVFIDDENFENEGTQYVVLSTIHKAKGLEFDYVFLIGLNETILPAKVTSLENLNEERRLAFVAYSRAIKVLNISCSNRHYINGKFKRLPPSRFISESGLYDIKY